MSPATVTGSPVSERLPPGMNVPLPAVRSIPVATVKLPPACSDSERAPTRMTEMIDQSTRLGTGLETGGARFGC
jgi:hypothetical protein